MLLKSQFSSNLSQHLGASKLEQLWVYEAGEKIKSQPTASQEFWRRKPGKEACHLFFRGECIMYTHTHTIYSFIIRFIYLQYIYIYTVYIYTLYLDIPAWRYSSNFQGTFLTSRRDKPTSGSAGGKSWASDREELFGGFWLIVSRLDFFSSTLNDRILWAIYSDLSGRLDTAKGIEKWGNPTQDGLIIQVKDL